jgi:hypothetical protein
MIKPSRCAIYTRKSSEEGLDQSFNEQGNRFTPTQRLEERQTLRYYTLQADNVKATTRLPALEFEQLAV